MASLTDLGNPNSPENREKIAAVVLQDTGFDDTLSSNEATMVRIEYGDLTQDGNRDAIITVSFGPYENIMAAYTLGEDGYEYLGLIGHFFGVDNLFIIRPEGAEQDVLLFRERNDQSMNAFESSAILRAYTYIDGEFKNVLSFDENVEARWNKCIQQEDKWCRIMQVSKIVNQNDYRVVNVLKEQTFSTAAVPSSRIRPVESDFVEQASRTVTETYTWDVDWQRYLLDKKIEKETGEVVGILQDFGDSPYVLVGDGFNRYKILRKDGTFDIVNYDEVEDIPAEAEMETPTVQ